MGIDGTREGEEWNGEDGEPLETEQAPMKAITNTKPAIPAE
jgi:hypothetical protein